MNILHISPSYKPAYIYGGPIVSVANLCENQAVIQNKVTVFSTTANGKSDFTFFKKEIEKVEIFYFKRWSGDHSHLSPKLIIKLFFNLKNSYVVHIHSWWNLVSIPAVFICWCRGIKPILSPRGMLSPYTLQNKTKLLFHLLFGKKLLKHTILHATSPQEAKEALALIPNLTYFVLPNIIHLPALETFINKSTSLQNCRLLFLSRIHPKKGLEIIFAALAELNFSWHLQIVGEGDINYILSLQKLAQDYNIAEKIEWVGWLNGAEKFQALADADLFVLPSLNENFANVVLESLAVGTPVVISDQVGLHDYVSEKNLGWVVPLDKEAWVQTLKTAWEARPLRAYIRAQAPSLIHDDFGAEHLAKQYLAAYQRYFPQKS